jgi:aminoglycoside phosphotransferase (APT) family kinase protein
MRREARVLAALTGTDVPHARLVAACPDVEPLGAAFLVCEHVDGASLWEPEGPPHDRPGLHRVGLAVAAAFGALARLDVGAAGLSDLSRPGKLLADQPDRWQAQLASYGGDGLPGAAEVHAWLVARVPGEEPAGLLHGDAHLGNVLVRADGNVAALVDWELTSLGDPLLDLGQLLATWPVPGSAYASRVTAPGLPTPAEVAREWERTSGRSAAALPWFRVLAGYRLAVLLEGTHARALAGQAPEETGRQLHAQALALVEDAAAAARQEE